MKRNTIKKFGFAFLINFLLFFMLLIFGPSEIFFSNVTEFDFVYGEFAGYMTLFAAAGAVIFSLVFSLLPDKAYRLAVSVIFAVSVGGYIQVMFLNKNLDLLGVNPEGYKISMGKSMGNLVIWLVIMLGVLILAFRKLELWKKAVMYLSVFLLLIQAVALISLTVSAKEEAYVYQEGSWHLSGENQYMVSANKNIIVIILDYFSNQYVEPMLAEYPDSVDFLHDFTYYSNMDCVYFGTFPSLPHMLTGNDVDMSCGVNEWCEKIWNNEKTDKFYKMLLKQNFVTNVYTPDTNILCGLNSAEILNGKLSNVVNSSQEIDIFYKLLFKTMAKMSSYRMFPDIVKPYFYANIDEYSKIVEVKDNRINHENYDFYNGLKENGLSVDRRSNYYIVQHLMGTHLYTTDESGNYKEDSTIEETAKGCMVIVEEYLNLLKDLGVYDDATIIVTSDHGGPYDSQVIFYMKEPQEKHDVSPVNTSPVSFNEFLPTIAEMAGVDYAEYGKSIHDYGEGEKRTRTVWMRTHNPNYPEVPCYTGDKDGESNVYFGYTYTGDIGDLLTTVGDGPDQIVPMVDSYF